MGEVYKMQAAPTIIKARNDQVELLAEILSDSFQRDPVMNWIIPNTSLYNEFFAIMSEQLILPNEHAYIDAEGRGAALWLPPGVHFEVPMSAAQVFLMLRLVVTRGPKVIKRLLHIQDIIKKHHPRTPHFYLQSVGARQAHQGMGVGSALIKQVTPLCDAAGMPAYLESSNEKNVALYQRHGFEVFHDETVGPGGPRMWFMLRQPREQ